MKIIDQFCSTVDR